jgi:hypothetical protein
MKLRFLVLAVLAVSLCFSGIVFADQVALTKSTKSMPGLLAHWPLEGNYQDASGNGRNGSAIGDQASFGWVAGVKGGKAVSIDSAKFNGTFADFPAPKGSPFDTPTATAIVWVKLSARDGDYWQAIAERSNLWYIETEAKPASWKGNAVVFRIYDPVAVGGGGSDQLRDNVNVTMENDKWYQIAFTYDGKVLIGFVNGKKVLSKDYAGGLGPVANTPDPPPAGKGKNYNLSLGIWQQKDDWFKGAIDDFSYYKSVLTEAQIKQLYDVMLSESSAVKSEGKLATTWGDAKN